MTKGSDRGTLNDITKSDILPFMKLSSRLTDFTKVSWCVSDEIRSSGTKTKYILDEIEMHCLTRFYQIVYPNVDPSKMFVPRTSWKIPIIYLCGELFGSCNSRSHRSSYITAYWCGSDGFIQPFETMYLNPRPGKINYFITHFLYVDDVPQEHLLACVEWFLPRPDHIRYKFGKPVEVWTADLLELRREATFIPVQRIKSKFIHIKARIDGRDSIVVVSRNRCLNI